MQIDKVNKHIFITTTKAVVLFLVIAFGVDAEKLTVDFNADQIGRHSRAPLRCTFSEPMIRMGFPKHSVPKGLSVEPPFSGKWSWESQSTLIFTPDSEWPEVNFYTVTIPAGIESTISHNRLKRSFVTRFSTGWFSAGWQNERELRSTLDSVEIVFTLAVHPDSLRSHLAGAPEFLVISKRDPWTFRMLPKRGWPVGRRITLSIDRNLTPLDGNLPLDTVVSTSFMVSDTLSCLGLYRYGKKVSHSDTLFLEDDYTIRFNRPLHRDAFRDYAFINGKPAASDLSETEISINRFLSPGKACTLSFGAGLPSIDSAFLFKDMRFVLVADSGRIATDLHPFTIAGVTARYADNDSIPPIFLGSATPIPLTMAMKFVFSTSPELSCDSGITSGRIYCFSSKGTDTLLPHCDSGLSVRPISFPEQSNCTLMVKAGFRSGGRQLKNDYTVVFPTGKPRVPDGCRPVINVWEDNATCRQHGREPRYWLLPDSPAIPLERFGNPRVISALRNISPDEALAPYSSTRFTPHRWIFDTLASPEPGVDWYQFLPLHLGPALSPQGRGCAEVLLSVNDTAFDTLGRFDVSDIGLQVMHGRLATAAIVTSLTKSIPISGAEVAFFGENRTLLAQGTTDSAGLMRTGALINPCFVRVMTPGDTLVNASDAGNFTDTAVTEGVLFTERRLYRPGDTICFKGVVRRLRDRWEPVAADSVVVSVPWRGGTPFVDTLPLVGIGSFYGAVAVPVDVARKHYAFTAVSLHTRCSLTCDVNVADIRPTELSGVAAEGIIDGDSLRFPVSAKWLHGGAAGGSPVTWKIHINRYHNNLSGGVEFSHFHETAIVAERSGNTFLDLTGKATVVVSRLPDDSGAGYSLTATVIGSAVQSVQMRRQVRVPWSHRIGVGYLTKSRGITGDTIVYSFMSIRENGKIVGNCRLNVDIMYHKEIRKRTTNRCGLPAVIRDTADVHLPKRSIITDTSGVGSVRFISLPPGDYTLTVSPPKPDTAGSCIKKFTVDPPKTNVERKRPDWLTAHDRACRNSDDEFTITELDTGVHAIGDTVRVRLKAASDSCRVALTISRENLYEYLWIVMGGRDTTIAVTIRDEFIPLVKVTASFLPQLRKKDQKFTFFQPPSVVAAAVNFCVSTESRRIPVQVTTDRSDYAPGDSVTVFLVIPSKFASATALVMAVDEGVLRLGRSPLPGVYEKFETTARDHNYFSSKYSFKCRHGAFDYDSINHLELHPRPLRRGVAGIGYGGGYGSGFGGSGSGGIDDLIGGLMGGDGGGGLDMKASGISIIRNPPRPCACFNPQVTFDADGKAICRFKLPGNLTRWRLTAVVDDTTCFGEDTMSFESNKPLMVRPQLPRFLRIGDSASAVYMVENRSKVPRNIAALVTARNDTTVDTFMLGPEEVRRCRFPLFGRAAGSDSLLFIARSDTLGDGAVQALPTIFERLSDVAAIGGSTVDSVRIPVLLPEPAKIDSGSLTLSLSTTRMQNLAEGARYLFEYPYGCLEQQSSRIMPLLVMGDFTRRFNLQMLSKGDDKAVIQTYLGHIGDFQNRVDGGLAYWPTDSGSSSPWLTAFVLETMIRAKSGGYKINDSVYSRALGYLRREMLRTDSDGRKQFIDSYTLLVMAQGGKSDRPALRRLFKDLKKLPFPARINLLKALHAAGGFRHKVAVLHKNLRRGLIEKDRLAYVAPGEAKGFEFCHESPVRLTSLILEALLETGSKSRFDEPMVRWLTEQRRGGRWRTTQENLAVFRAFAAYTKVYEHDAPKLDATVKLAGSIWFSAVLEGREGAIARASRSLDSIRAHGETVVSVDRGGYGRLYWDLLIPTIPAGEAPAVSSGLSISRTVTLISGDTNAPFDPSQLNVGQLIRVTGTIRCNQDITFAAINDPIPAGCEVVNPELNSAERGVAAKTTGWYGPSGLSHREFRDSRVLLFANEMPAGEYRFSHVLKVTTAGEFSWPAPTVEAMYYPEFHGRGEEGRVVVGECR